MKRICLTLVVCAALVAGCGKPEDKFVGKWDGKATLPKEMIDLIKSMAPADEQDNILKELNDAKVELELKSDMTYAIVSNSRGQTTTETGKWSLDKEGKNVTLAAPEMGEEAKKRAKAAGATDEMLEQQKGMAMQCVISKDGRAMTYTQSQMGMTVTMTFTKK